MIIPSRKLSTNLILSLILIAAVFAVFSQTTGFSFISYDDPLYVENPHILAGFSPTSIIWAFTDATNDSNYWAPVVWLSFMADFALFDSNPGGYHLTNVLLHALCAVVLFLFFVRVTKRPGPSFFAAALFAIHPLRAESVAWVTERKDVLSALIFFLGLHAYARYCQAPGKKNYAWLFVLYLVGLMAKPMNVTFPFVLLLMDFWPFGRITRLQLQQIWPLIKEKIPLFVLSFVVAGAAFATQQKAGAIVGMDTISFWIRLTNSLWGYVFYLGKMIWPVHLGILYPHPGDIGLVKPILAATILIIITGFCLIRTKTQPYLATGWFFYLGTLFPVIGLVVIGPHAVADRYTYIPLTGIFFAVTFWLDDWTKSRPKMSLAVSLPGAILCGALAFTCFFQTAHWKDNLSIYRHTLEVTQNNWAIHMNLGKALDEAGKPFLAIAQYQSAAKIRPDLAAPLHSVGHTLFQMGKHKKAIDYFDRAVSVQPAFAPAYTAKALCLEELGQKEQAYALFAKAVEVDPAYAQGHDELGVSLLFLGQTKQASEHFFQAISADPDYFRSHYNLAVIFSNQGQWDKAFTHFSQAAFLKPDFADAHYGLGVCFLIRGNTQMAKNAFFQVLKISPKHAGALDQMRQLTGNG